MSDGHDSSLGAAAFSIDPSSNSESSTAVQESNVSEQLIHALTTKEDHVSTYETTTDQKAAESEAPPPQDDAPSSSSNVAPDLEHIVSAAVLDSPAESMESLREAVRKAREATGAQREALPPGFDDSPKAADARHDSDEEDDVLAVEQSLLAGQKRKAQDDYESPSKKEKHSSNGGEADVDSSSAWKDPEAQSMLDRAMSIIEGASNGENGKVAAASDSKSGSDSDSSDSSDSDSDDSDDDDDDSAPAAKVKPHSKDPAAEASDDETNFAEATPATKHEIVAPKVEPPPVQQLSPTDLAMIRPLGKIHSIVSSVVVVEQEVTKTANQSADDKAKAKAVAAPVDNNGRQGKQEGEYSVLDTESLLCFEDGKVLGLVFETFGSIHSPMYSVRFPSAFAIDQDVVKVGKPTFYLPSSSTYVLTRVLKSMKGSDASNVFDEEVGEEEMDYSDDEAEAEAKRRTKRKNVAKKNGDNAPDPKGKGKGGRNEAKQGVRRSTQRLGQPFEGGRQPVTGLPARPRSSLPARPNFDYDVPPSDAHSMAGPAPAGRRILSYDDAGAGGDTGIGPVPIEMAVRGQWGAKAQGPAARGWHQGTASLPAKPTGLPPSPHLNQMVSSTHSSPGRPQASTPFTPSPQLDPPTFGSPSTVHQGYAPQATPPFQSTPTMASSSSPPFRYPATAGGEAAAASGGHYNPRFAGFWSQQTGQWGQLPAAGYGQAYQGYSYPGTQQPQAYGGQHPGAYGQQASTAQRTPYAQSYGATPPSYYSSYGATVSSATGPVSPQFASSYANAYPGYGYGGAAATYDPKQPSMSDDQFSPPAHYPTKPQ